MLQYRAGFKHVETGVHAQVLDFPAAITFGHDLTEARRLLGIALVDVAEAAVESGQALPVPNPNVFDPEMDIEESIYLYLQASADVREVTIASPRLADPARVGDFTKRVVEERPDAGQR